MCCPLATPVTTPLPVRLVQMRRVSVDTCSRCGWARGTLIHMVWELYNNSGLRFSTFLTLSWASWEYARLGIVYLVWLRIFYLQNMVSVTDVLGLLSHVDLSMYKFTCVGLRCNFVESIPYFLIPLSLYVFCTSFWALSCWFLWKCINKTIEKILGQYRPGEQGLGGEGWHMHGHQLCAPLMDVYIENNKGPPLKIS